MSVNYETDLLAKTAVELRKIGASLQIPGAAKGRKADLVIAIAARYEGERLQREQANRERAAAQEAQKANQALEAKKSAKPAKKRCAVCQVRPTTKESPEGQLCTPCLTKAEWDNTHSDFGHDAEGPETDDMAQADGRVKGCWVCYPELDESAEDYTPKSGTSRSGMRMTVRRGATGEEKAKTVIDSLGAEFATSVKVEKGLVTLTVASKLGHGAKLVWDRNGAYQYGPSTITVEGKTRKVRNVSELLKICLSKYPSDKEDGSRFGL